MQGRIRERIAQHRFKIDDAKPWAAAKVRLDELHRVAYNVHNDIAVTVREIQSVKGAEKAFSPKSDLRDAEVVDGIDYDVSVRVPRKMIRRDDAQAIRVSLGRPACAR